MERIQDYLAREFLTRKVRPGLFRDGRQNVNGVVNSIFKGERISAWEVAEKTLIGWDKDIEGSKFIPQSDRLVVVMNHWPKGPLWAKWSNVLISCEVSKVHGQDVGWISQDSVNFWLINKEIPFSRRAIQKMAASFGLILVRNLNTGGHDYSASESMRGIKILRGRIVGVLPEGKNGHEKLGHGIKNAGAVLDALARLSIRSGVSSFVLPAGVWNDGRTLHVRFGEPVATRNFAVAHEGERTDEDFRRVADKSLDLVNGLLPKEYRR